MKNLFNSIRRFFAGLAHGAASNAPRLEHTIRSDKN